MQFLYMGFSQQANTRSFRFQGVVASKKPSASARKLEFLLTADMALLAEHRIRVQDGPTLCLRILAGAITADDSDTVRFSSYSITSADVCAFTGARDALEQTRAARRKPRPHFKPAESSQLKWPRYK